MSGDVDVEYNEQSTLHLILEGKDMVDVGGWFGSTDPFFMLLASTPTSSGSVIWQTVYTSEEVPQCLNPRWKKAQVKLHDLCKGDVHKPIRITVVDWEPSEKHNPMGYFETTVADLLQVSGDASKTAPLRDRVDGEQVDYGKLVVRLARIKTPRNANLENFSAHSRRSLRRSRSTRSSTGRGLDSASLHSRRSIRFIEPEFQFEHSDLLHLTLEGRGLVDVSSWFVGNNPYFQIAIPGDSKIGGKIVWQTVYRSEHLEDTLNPFWKEAPVMLYLLCGGDIDKSFRIFVFSHVDSATSTPMGHVDTTLKEVIKSSKDSDHELRLKNDKGEECGKLAVLHAQLPEDFSDGSDSVASTISNRDYLPGEIITEGGVQEPQDRDDSNTETSDNILGIDVSILSSLPSFGLNNNEDQPRPSLFSLATFSLGMNEAEPIESPAEEEVQTSKSTTEDHLLETKSMSGKDSMHQDESNLQPSQPTEKSEDAKRQGNESSRDNRSSEDGGKERENDRPSQVGHKNELGAKDKPQDVRSSHSRNTQKASNHSSDYRTRSDKDSSRREGRSSQQGASAEKEARRPDDSRKSVDATDRQERRSSRHGSSPESERKRSDDESRRQERRSSQRHSTAPDKKVKSPDASNGPASDSGRKERRSSSSLSEKESRDRTSKSPSRPAAEEEPSSAPSLSSMLGDGSQSNSEDIPKPRDSLASYSKSVRGLRKTMALNNAPPTAVRPSAMQRAKSYCSRSPAGENVQTDEPLQSQGAARRSSSFDVHSAVAMQPSEQSKELLDYPSQQSAAEANLANKDVNSSVSKGEVSNVTTPQGSPTKQKVVTPISNDEEDRDSPTSTNEPKQSPPSLADRGVSSTVRRINIAPPTTLRPSTFEKTTETLEHEPSSQIRRSSSFHDNDGAFVAPAEDPKENSDSRPLHTPHKELAQELLLPVKHDSVPATVSSEDMRTTRKPAAHPLDQGKQEQKSAGSPSSALLGSGSSPSKTDCPRGQVAGNGNDELALSSTSKHGAKRSEVEGLQGGKQPRSPSKQRHEGSHSKGREERLLQDALQLACQSTSDPEQAKNGEQCADTKQSGSEPLSRLGHPIPRINQGGPEATHAQDCNKPVSNEPNTAAEDRSFHRAKEDSSQQHLNRSDNMPTFEDKGSPKEASSFQTMASGRGDTSDLKADSGPTEGTSSATASASFTNSNRVDITSLVDAPADHGRIVAPADHKSKNRESEWLLLGNPPLPHSLTIDKSCIPEAASADTEGRQSFIHIDGVNGNESSEEDLSGLAEIPATGSGISTLSFESNDEMYLPSDRDNSSRCSDDGGQQQTQAFQGSRVAILERLHASSHEVFSEVTSSSSSSAEEDTAEWKNQTSEPVISQGLEPPESSATCENGGDAEDVSSLGSQADNSTDHPVVREEATIPVGAKAVSIAGDVDTNDEASSQGTQQRASSANHQEDRSDDDSDETPSSQSTSPSRNALNQLEDYAVRWKNPKGAVSNEGDVMSDNSERSTQSWGSVADFLFASTREILPTLSASDSPGGQTFSEGIENEGLTMSDGSVLTDEHGDPGPRADASVEPKVSEENERLAVADALDQPQLENTMASLPKRGATLYLRLAGKNLANMGGWFGSTNALYQVSCSVQNDGGVHLWQSVYESECLENSLDPKWNEADINLDILCGGDPQKRVRISVYDLRNGARTLMGSCYVNLNELLSVGGNSSELILSAEDGTVNGKLVVMGAMVKELEQHRESSFTLSTSDQKESVPSRSNTMAVTVDSTGVGEGQSPPPPLSKGGSNEVPAKHAHDMGSESKAQGANEDASTREAISIQLKEQKKSLAKIEQDSGVSESKAQDANEDSSTREAVSIQLMEQKKSLAKIAQEKKTLLDYTKTLSERVSKLEEDIEARDSLLTSASTKVERLLTQKRSIEVEWAHSVRRAKELEELKIKQDESLIDAKAEVLSFKRDLERAQSRIAELEKQNNDMSAMLDSAGIAGLSLQQTKARSHDGDNLVEPRDSEEQTCIQPGTAPEVQDSQLDAATEQVPSRAVKADEEVDETGGEAEDNDESAVVATKNDTGKEEENGEQQESPGEASDQEGAQPGTKAEGANATSNATEETNGSAEEDTRAAFETIAALTADKGVLNQMVAALEQRVEELEQEAHDRLVADSRLVATSLQRNSMLDRRTLEVSLAEAEFKVQSYSAAMLVEGRKLKAAARERKALVEKVADFKRVAENNLKTVNEAKELLARYKADRKLQQSQKTELTKALNEVKTLAEARRQELEKSQNRVLEVEAALDKKNKLVGKTKQQMKTLRTEKSELQSEISGMKEVKPPCSGVQGKDSLISQDVDGSTKEPAGTQDGRRSGEIKPTSTDAAVDSEEKTVNSEPTADEPDSGTNKLRDSTKKEHPADVGRWEVEREALVNRIRELESYYTQAMLERQAAVTAKELYQGFWMDAKDKLVHHRASTKRDPTAAFEGPAASQADCKPTRSKPSPDELPDTKQTTDKAATGIPTKREEGLDFAPQWEQGDTQANQLTPHVETQEHSLVGRPNSEGVPTDSGVRGLNVGFEAHESSIRKSVSEEGLFRWAASAKANEDKQNSMVPKTSRDADLRRSLTEEGCVRWATSFKAKEEKQDTMDLFGSFNEASSKGQAKAGNSNSPIAPSANLDSTVSGVTVSGVPKEAKDTKQENSSTSETKDKGEGSKAATKAKVSKNKVDTNATTRASNADIRKSLVDGGLVSWAAGFRAKETGEEDGFGKVTKFSTKKFRRVSLKNVSRLTSTKRDSFAKLEDKTVGKRQSKMSGIKRWASQQLQVSKASPSATDDSPINGEQKTKASGKLAKRKSKHSSKERASVEKESGSKTTNKNDAARTQREAEENSKMKPKKQPTKSSDGVGGATGKVNDNDPITTADREGEKQKQTEETAKSEPSTSRARGRERPSKERGKRASSRKGRSLSRGKRGRRKSRNTSGSRGSRKGGRSLSRGVRSRSRSRSTSIASRASKSQLNGLSPVPVPVSSIEKNRLRRTSHRVARISAADIARRQASGLAKEEIEASKTDQHQKEKTKEEASENQGPEITLKDQSETSDVSEEGEPLSPMDDRTDATHGTRKSRWFGLLGRMKDGSDRMKDGSDSEEDKEDPSTPKRDKEGQTRDQDSDDSEEANARKSSGSWFGLLASPTPKKKRRTVEEVLGTPDESEEGEGGGADDLAKKIAGSWFGLLAPPKPTQKDDEAVEKEEEKEEELTESEENRAASPPPANSGNKPRHRRGVSTSALMRRNRSDDGSTPGSRRNVRKTKSDLSSERSERQDRKGRSAVNRKGGGTKRYSRKERLQKERERNQEAKGSD